MYMDPEEFIDIYLKEDLGTGDITTTSLGIEKEGARAEIVANESCILAGGEEARLVFAKMGVDAVQEIIDGGCVEGGDRVMAISGAAGGILAGERLALNILSRMSGIATATRATVNRVHEVNPNVSVAATRKTTPGFRYFEKKAVALGGGETHRQRLDDLVLIKDNHIAMLDDVVQAIKLAKAQPIPVEVEVENIEQSILAARAGADIILLDNMGPKEARECYEAVKSISYLIIVEASGGITPETAHHFANCADRISMSRLTTYSRPIDMSLNIT